MHLLTMCQMQMKQYRYPFLYPLVKQHSLGAKEPPYLCLILIISFLNRSAAPRQDTSLTGMDTS